jgi:adenosylhomocysteine nucleosidase
VAHRREVRTGGSGYTTGELAGRPIILACTGIGARAARRVSDWLIRAARPRALIAVGFAGGLAEGLSAGDLVLAEEIYEPPPPEGEGPREWRSDAALLAAALEAAVNAPRFQVGRMVTVRALTTSSSARRELAERHHAVAVDMESSGIARAANVHDVPALYARAVVDEVGYDWPLDFSALLNPEGRVRPLAVALRLLRKPSASRGLLDLFNRSRRAGETLARYLPALVAALPPL